MVRWLWVAGLVVGACGESSGGAETSSGVLAVPDSVGVAEVSAQETSQGAQVPTVTVSAELERKLVELAVASECARREAVPAERAIPRLEALFAAQGVTLAEYSDAMAQLVSDRELHEAIGARLGSCGVLVEALWPKSAQGDVEVVEDAVADVGSGADTADTGLGALGEVSGQGGDVGPAEDAGARDTTAAPTNGDAKVAPDTSDGTDGADVKEPPKPAPTWSGTWVGALKGKQSGNLRVTVSGRTVTGAVATFGRSTIRLKGSLSDKGSLSLGGTVGDEFVRLSGRVDRAGQVITGTWDGVIDRKRSSGSFRLSR